MMANENFVAQSEWWIEIDGQHIPIDQGDFDELVRRMNHVKYTTAGFYGDTFTTEVAARIAVEYYAGIAGPSEVPTVTPRPHSVACHEPGCEVCLGRQAMRPAEGVLATWMTVDAGTDHEHEAWVPWPFIPAVPKDRADRIEAERDAITEELGRLTAEFLSRDRALTATCDELVRVEDRAYRVEVAARDLLEDGGFAPTDDLVNALRRVLDGES